MNDSHSENPYQPPAILADDDEMIGSLAVKDRLLLQKCQQQMVALGVLWMVTGLFGSGITAFVWIADTISEPQDFIFYALVGLALVSSILHFIAGLLAWFKQLSAVYLGLVIGYPTALGNLLVLNFCPFLMLGIGLLLAHRALRWAKELRARGVPLSTPVKPSP